MKKSLILCTILFIIISLCSCGAGTQPQNEAKQEGISFSGTADEAEIRADDGTLVYKASVAYPEITINGNEASQKKINAYFEQEISKILSPEKDYISEYESYKADGLDYFSNAEISVAITNLYSDDKIISFTVDSYIHEACAISGYEYKSGLCFSKESGEKLELDNLATDTAEFNSKLIKAVTASLAQMEKDGKIADVSTDDALNSIISREVFWTVDGETLTVIFPTGSIAPNYLGSIEIPVKLEEFDGTIII